MKKVFRLTGLDCPNCAMKLEKKLNGVKGVNSAQVNFMAMRLTLDIDDDKFDAVLEEVRKQARKIDDTELV